MDSPSTSIGLSKRSLKTGQLSGDVRSPRLGAAPAYSPRTHPIRNRSRNDRDEGHVSWSLNIGKVAGTVVRLHITFELLLAWIFVSNYASSDATIAWNSPLFMVLLLLCVLLHEFGDIFTARAFGVPTLYVTLNDAIRTRQGAGGAGRVDLAIERNGC
jgi:hypothetical protein